MFNRVVGRALIAALWSCLSCVGFAYAQSTVTYTYDGLGRVTGATYSAGDAVSYSYDAAGNRTQTTATPPAPSVSAKSIATAYGAPGSVNLAPSGVWTGITFPAAPAKGTLSLAGSTVTYTPNAGTYGADSFTFRATGPGGASGVATVSVTVAVPVAPTVSAKALSSGYNTSGAVDLAPSGVWSAIGFPAAPGKGTLSLSGSTVTYTPNAGTYGADSFTFNATGPGGTSSAATVSVTVANPPAPTVSAKSISTGYNAAGAVNLAPAGVWSSIAFPSGPTKGTLSLSGSTVTYTPNNGTYGTDSFTFTASGPGGTSSAATVSVTVANPAAPVVANKSLSAGYNAAGAVDLAPSGVWSSISFPAGPAKGALSLSGSTVTYTPNNGAYGADSFTFQASGPGGASGQATVNVTIANPPAPTVSAKSLSTGYNAAGAVNLAPSGVWSSIGFPAAPGKGTLSLSGSTVTYTPNAGTYGADSFTFNASGPGGTSAAASVSVSVGLPPAPVVSNKVLSTGYGASGSADLAPSGVWSSIGFPNAPSKGTLSLSGSTVTYTPNGGAYGSDSFTFTASGPGGTSSVGTVSVTIGNPPAPVVSNKVLSTGYGASGSADLAPSGVWSSIGFPNAPSKGTLSLSGSTVTYTPNGGAYGADSFTFQASGPGGASSVGTVSVAIGNPPAPSVSNRSISTAHNAAGAVDLAPSGVWSSIGFPSGPSKGTLSLSGSVVTYTPNTGTYGADSFTFAASGPGGTSAAATVNVSVANPPNRAPVAENDFETFYADQPVTLWPLQNDSDPDGDPLTIVAITQPGNGVTASFTGNTISLNRIVSGTIVVTYTISDGQGHTAQANFFITGNLGTPEW
ncbi:Ig-like domain-containing protein [Caulobacter radicis]|uniref:Tandem-95 repeat protein n=1 Tax=Caulobacter radicis TaxID=2172650 RepID=A0A2T9JQM9_9CAUL|nr:Ig-like domain-containing protein [Caulobacter radicis]PVM86017.1 hypothetical protein DDF65_06230 [Caulobacter radicis]